MASQSLQTVLKELGIQQVNPSSSTGRVWTSLKGKTSKQILSPVDGGIIASVEFADEKEYNAIVETAQKAFEDWRKRPAPFRGEIVRQIGEKLREHKQNLGTLVTYETGKILQEGLGEVQEMIDICDFAVGLSRQLYGLTMHSERPEHRMYEQY